MLVKCGVWISVLMFVVSGVDDVMFGGVDGLVKVVGIVVRVKMSVVV